MPSTIELLKGRPAQVGIIAVALAAVVSAFAYVGGYLTPHRIGPNQLLNVLEASSGGRHEGFRRAHAKGICMSGNFVGAAAGRALSAAVVFAGNRVPVTGRFAKADTDPFVNDAESLPALSMALRFRPEGAGEWRMAIVDTPGLSVSTPRAFVDNTLASTPDPRTGKPDPEKMKAFLDQHPETVAFMARMKKKPLASGFANDSYNSVDGFLFVAADGGSHLVRWSMQAEDPFETSAPAERAAKSANYLFDDLLARVARGPMKWRMVATVALPGDPNRAAEVWPDARQQVDMGELTIDHIDSEAAGNCRDVNFDPLILPPGVAPSDDPIPFARSAIYSASFRRRSEEPKTPSAVANERAASPR